jgi:hypothetical protein
MLCVEQCLVGWQYRVRLVAYGRPLDNRPMDLREDALFLQSDKLYMASVSPLFSTHYGSTGQWAFNK